MVACSVAQPSTFIYTVIMNNMTYCMRNRFDGNLLHGQIMVSSPREETNLFMLFKANLII